MYQVQKRGWYHNRKFQNTQHLSDVINGGNTGFVYVATTW